MRIYGTIICVLLSLAVSVRAVNAEQRSFKMTPPAKPTLGVALNRYREPAGASGYELACYTAKETEGCKLERLKNGISLTHKELKRAKAERIVTQFLARTRRFAPLASQDSPLTSSIQWKVTDGQETRTGQIATPPSPNLLPLLSAVLQLEASLSAEVRR